MKSYFLNLLILSILVYSLVLALDLPQKHLKQTDDWARRQAETLANILSFEKNLSYNFTEVESKYYPLNFIPLTKYFLTKETGNEKNIFVCFTPKSKYHKAGTEMQITPEGKSIEYMGVITCNNNCLECAKK
jgi:hypothetical protein